MIETEHRVQIKSLMSYLYCKLGFLNVKKEILLGATRPLIPCVTPWSQNRKRFYLWVRLSNDDHPGVLRNIFPAVNRSAPDPGDDRSIFW